MSVHAGRCAIAMVATFAASFVIFGASFFVLPVDMGAWQMDHGRSQEDALRHLGLIGHVIQTVAFTLIYFVLVRSRRLVAGITYGFLMGIYLSAIDLTVLAAIKSASATFTFFMIPVNLTVGVVSGWLLAFLYRPPAKQD